MNPIDAGNASSAPAININHNMPSDGGGYDFGRDWGTGVCDVWLMTKNKKY
jgi:hypothetical protein